MVKKSKSNRVIRYGAIRLPGRWKLGFALDRHTLSSEFCGYDEYGHEQFDTIRSDLGELLYRYKYKNDDRALGPIVRTAAGFIQKRKLKVDFIIPFPASKKRPSQPVHEMAIALGQQLSIPVVVALKKIKKTSELKSIHDFNKRIELLEDAINLTSDAKRIKEACILLFDDLWRSGATLNAAAAVLMEKANVKEIIALTITRTRSKQ